MRWAAIAVSLIGFTIAIGFLATRQPPDLQEYWAIQAEWQQANRSQRAPANEQFAARCLEISQKYPGTQGALSVLLLGAWIAPETKPGGDVRHVAIFPQAREGENWSADAPGGKRAIAILNLV